MPPYLLRKDNTYYFRQSVPAELRTIIGRREIKKSLGRDFGAAVRECKRYAVTADNLLADARAQLDSRPVDPYSWEGIRRTRHVPITQVTPELEDQFGNLMKASLLESDEEHRIAGMTADEFNEYGEHIQAGLAALRKQLAMGNVTPMLETAPQFIIGRGYAPQFSPEDWRRIAYVMTRATLEAYEGMAARQAGQVIRHGEGNVLASQFEVQNARPNAAATDQPVITWNALYDVWVSECERRENTVASYRAAMKLFMGFCPKAPEALTREDALAFRDFLTQVQKLSPATVSNKIGFIGTLINSARNSAKYAKHFPHNPFEHIKVKRAKRGKSDAKRQPFTDAELKTIFSSTIYTEGHRPRGGGGDAAAWMPAIAYLTGMRLEEIATLHRRQFHVDSAGNHFIQTEDGKNDNSADREVPLHPALIEAGLLDYVKTCSGPLFPEVKCTNEVQSKAYSQWYGRYLSTLGITARSKVFHSFRHLFKDLCRNVDLDDSAIDQICGHEPGTVGGKYGSGRRVDVLARLVAKINPPVALPKITAQTP
jgi:integrase